MEAYSKEFRRDVLAACDAGEGTRSVALRFEVSESWVRRIKQERREQGKIAPLSTRRRRRIWEPHAEWLLAKLDKRRVADELSDGVTDCSHGVSVRRPPRCDVGQGDDTFVPPAAPFAMTSRASSSQRESP